MRYAIILGLVGVLALDQAWAQAAKSCSDLRTQCDAWCDGPKMNTSSRDHCHDHVKDSFDLCKRGGIWETYQPTLGRWCDVGKVTGLEKR